MTIPLCLGFEDFKELSKDKRLYYYVGNNYYDFLFITDGIFVKTTIPIETVDNPRRFFSDPMFYGAKRIYFRVPNPYFNPLEDVDFIKPETELEKPIIEVSEVQEEEVKNIDIQQEGVE